MPTAGRFDLLRSALRVSSASAVWTLVASVASVGLGLADDSLALVAFGAVGLFDCAADVVLVVHFRSARAGDDADHLERIALRVITTGLLAVGAVTSVVSVVQLVDQHHPNTATATAGLAGVSFVGLSALAVRKLQVSTRLSSRALRADGRLTAVGAMLAAVTLIGTATANAFGWWWADPTAALVIAIGAIGLAILIHREAEPS